MRYVPSPSTIYNKINKVEPGQLITFDLKQNLKVRKHYFIKNPESLGYYKGEYRHIVKEYGDLFEKAIQRQLMADVEVGILLSGGVDSALIAAIAKQYQPAIKAFTIGFEGNFASIDEVEQAMETAHLLGLKHYYKRIGFDNFIESIDQIMEIVEEPVATTSIIPMFFLSELASSKVKVVLSGQGADEPLGGYHKYKGLHLIEKFKFCRRMMSATKSLKFYSNNNENLRRQITSMQATDDISSYNEFNSIFSVDDSLKLIAPSLRSIFYSELKKEQYKFRKILEEKTPKHTNIKDLFLYYDVRTSLADNLLMYTDKVTMHFGLECRVPILDNDLINFIESIDTKHKFNYSTSKIIHKKFAKEYLPASIIERKKIGFLSPTSDWFKHNQDKIKQQFTVNENHQDLFCSDSIEKLLDIHNKGQNMEKQIFLLLSIISIIKNS
jgi:asparagine synthase (glutamine-hydrolysing)